MILYKIAFNSNFSFVKRFKVALKYLNESSGATRNFRRRYKLNRINGYRKRIKLTGQQLREYKEYWQGFKIAVETETVEMCYNISGKFDKKIIPENIYASDIEPTLNIRKDISYLTNKSFYNKWFPKEIFPKDLFHKIEGEFYSASLDLISESEIVDILGIVDYPIVVKPNVDTYGGKDVYFPNSQQEALLLLRKFDNLVIQEKLVQHNFLNNIYSDSINTIRVCLYRSVTTNKFKVINASLRMGKDGSLDNETSGGIVCSINNEGYLNSFAVDKYGITYNEHPNSKYSFKDKVPNFDELIYKSIEVADNIFYSRIVSLDACLTSSGDWRIIEVNLLGQTIRFAQYAGLPFFGDFTDEVIDYCKKNHWSLN